VAGRFARIVDRAARGGLVGRLALVSLVLACGVVLSGCSGEAGADPGSQFPHYPAAAAGGACLLLDYDTINEAIGVRFDTAGASRRDDTYTCAVTQRGASYPDLTLSVTPTKADELIFAASVTPSGSTPVKGLGKAAYQIASPAAGKRGPRWEVGWLSDNQRLMVLRFTYAKGVSADDAAGLKAKVADLAKRIDRTNV
jgi:hypothetical protein